MTLSRHSYRLSPAAQRDLSQIWDFTEERWDPHLAETCIGELRAAIERVAADPRRGRARDEIREGYFSYGVVSHVLFYRESEETGGVDIIRILHQRMDPARHL